MGIFSKLVTTASQIITSKGTTDKITTSVGNVISNKMISKCEEELKELEVRFELDKQNYLRKKEKLQAKINRGDKFAIKKLRTLENEFKIIQIRYDGDKNVILSKQPKLEEKHKNKIKEEISDSSTVIENTKHIQPLSIKCEKCGQTSPKGVKFCSNCGTQFAENHICSNCGTTLLTNSNFCPNCGQKR